MTLARTMSQTKSTFHSIEEIHFILMAVRVTFPAILVLQWPFIRHTVYSKYHSIMIPVIQIFTEELTNGYFVAKTVVKRFDNFTVINMHKCKSGSIISSVFVCDGNFDCGESDTGDEDNCTCKVVDEAKEKKV